MIVRTIRPEEFKRVQQFCSLVFEYPLENEDLAPMDYLKNVQNNPEGTLDLHCDSWWAAFEEDDRTMTSSFAAIPYQANFDGHTVGMMGIGGVATLPQYRRQGGIRACFEHALPDFYEKGFALSYLYPFSTCFYRKFGYELGAERLLLKLKMDAVPPLSPTGTFHLLEPGADLLADFKAVDAVFQRRYNLMVIEGDVEYSWVRKADPFRDKAYTYVYRAADGTPKAYMTYQPIIDQGDRTLDCTRRFCFTDLEGFRALFYLLTRLKADHSHILVNLPTGVSLTALIHEWSFMNVSRQEYVNGMVRVVNAEQILKLASMKGEGSLVIELKDEQIVQNNGRFRVAFAPGKENSVERTEEAADVSLTIQDFSRLICGRYDVEDWYWLPDAKLMCDPEKAARVFYRKPMYITTRF